MLYGPTNFRSTVVKPYYFDLSQIAAPITTPEAVPEDAIVVDVPGINTPDAPNIVISARRGCLRGSKNKLKAQEQHSIYLLAKEQNAQDLAVKLRQEGTIVTPGLLFKASDIKEIKALIARGVFAFKQFNKLKHNRKIFKLRIVREVKNKTTNLYEKLRLVIQAYNNYRKEVILTQSPTIQRASQRIIVALALTLLKHKISLWLRDITQAYVQSATFLQRQILAKLLKEIEHLYPKDTIIVVVKPLYGIAEAGTHWWSTYSKHHKNKLQIETSTYDACLLITASPDRFGIVGMQTDDTLGISDLSFAELEEKELAKAGFTAKPKETLSIDAPLQFNGCVLTLQQDGSIMLCQKGQGKSIQIIETSANH